ncbi:GlcG/HbpS family heme-binding protein [Pseudomonas fluorescens]|uniref:GlcG/HbpS family heme-binding protein n=1 Tax=Pseudomonas fluorescens TaxID=294 RepID=UPI00223AA072|nr:heme-binding protein [Pseudomonas fluorescens]
MKTASHFTAFIALIAPLMFAGPALAGSSSLTSQMAQKMVAGAERAAQEKGYSIVVSIVDKHGNLKHFHRMDNTSVGSIEVSRLKASTSAKFPVSTKVLAERSAGLPSNPYAAVPGFLLLEGGLPIMSKGGVHMGGIGISGATPELDAAFAQAAIDQLHQ